MVRPLRRFAAVSAALLLPAATAARAACSETGSERLACVEVAAEGGPCAAARIEPVRELGSGELRLVQLARHVPELLRLEVLGSSCGSRTDHLEWFLNGTFLGDLEIDPELRCCQATPRAIEVSGDEISRLWDPRGPNRVSVGRSELASHVSWIRVEARSGALSETRCVFDSTFTNCRIEQTCSLFRIEFEGEADLELVERIPMRRVPYAHGELPGSFDIGALPTGPAEICIAEEIGPLLYGSTRSGELLVIDPATADATAVGSLPRTIYEIEYDPSTARGIASGLVRAFEFDFRDGATLGGSDVTFNSFRGLEFVGGRLFAGWTPFLTEFGRLVTVSLPGWRLESGGPTRARPIEGLAYEATTGLLYGIDGGPGPSTLFAFDPGSSTVEEIGSTGFEAGSLAFGPDGVLYGGGVGPDGGSLFRIDASTGRAERVGATGFDSLTGLALVPSQALEDCARFARTSETGLTIDGAACVEVDVRPARLDLGRPGRVPVAIVGSEDLDFADVDLRTLEFGPLGARPVFEARAAARGPSGAGRHLTTHYRIEETGIGAGDARACLRGATLDGATFESCDEVSGARARSTRRARTRAGRPGPDPADEVPQPRP